MMPRDAIVSSVKDPSVYRIENGIARLVKVEIGRDDNSFVEVLSGLNAGDQVTTTGQINLSDGAKVSIDK
jgi:multidrug efflux pump subunit AcrA (membrane-fusion protein)